jgi:spore cortex formation protein SpoVR/YcgB (stage V sporulation)
MKKIGGNQDWNFDLLRDVLKIVEDIAAEIGLDIYPNVLEVVTAEQMLDSYCSIGLPIIYNHWSFGKRFEQEYKRYKATGALAYELVINSNPCISYLMENNSAIMQTMVIAHACVGHNFFFKNNASFLEWTKADYILEYMHFARNYIKKCEDRYGGKVEDFLDILHVLKPFAVDKYPRVERGKTEKPIMPYYPLFLPERGYEKIDRSHEAWKEEENLFYFIRKNSVVLEDWQKEIMRILGVIEQYFYPQVQTKIMNEGCATTVHYEFMNMMYDRGYIDEGGMLEFIEHHSSVIANPPRYVRANLNPYALGFNVCQDIKSQSGWDGLKFAWKNFRDDSFLQQYLSERVVKDMKMMSIYMDENLPYYEVRGTARDFDEIRVGLAKMVGLPHYPELDIKDFSNRSRKMVVEIRNVNAVDKKRILDYTRDLTGFTVEEAKA